MPSRSSLPFAPPGHGAPGSTGSCLYLYRALLDGALAEHDRIDPRESWMLAAAEADLPLLVPGWEVSTLGNIFVASHLRGKIASLGTVESGLYAMNRLVACYREATGSAEVGCFQIGGGIAGDLPICVVPLVFAYVLDS